MSSESPFVAPVAPWYRRRLILLIGIGAALIVAATVGLAATQLLSPPQPDGPTLLATHLPADTLVYAELDLEPEGGQAAALDALNERLAAFGAGDGAARLLDPLLEGLSGGEYSYSRDIRPWTDGRVALAVLDWGSLGQVPNPLFPLPTDPVAPGTVILVGVEDRAGATAFTDRLRAAAAEMGLGFASSEHGSWTTWTAAPDAPGQVGVAYAVGDELLIVGTRGTDVREVIDLHDEGGETLADVESFRSEVARLPAERIGTILTRPGSLPAGLLGGGLLGIGDSTTADLIFGLLPLDQAGALVLAEDRVIFERWQPSGTSVSQPAERQNDRLAAGFPINTSVYAELPEFGRLLSAIGSAIAFDAERLGGEEGAREVARVEALLGRDLGDIGDWLGDVSFGVGADGLPAVGVVGEVHDAESAAQMLDGAVDLMAGPGAPVDREDINGVQLVRMEVPFLFGSITVELALADDRVLFGSEGFTDWVQSAPDGLGGDPSYRTALDEAGGAENAGVVYLSVERILRALRDDPSMQPPDWETMEPRLASIRDAILVTFVEDDSVQSRLEIRLADPDAPD